MKSNSYKEIDEAFDAKIADIESQFKDFFIRRKDPLGLECHDHPDRHYLIERYTVKKETGAKIMTELKFKANSDIPPTIMAKIIEAFIKIYNER